MLKKIALFIDADNASHLNINTVITKLSEYGSITAKKAFGNWEKPEFIAWLNQLDKYDIEPIHQLDTTKRKNSTDIALTIGVIDMLHTHDIDVYAIMSSDGDFTPLAERLLSAGKVVIGLGGRNASHAFVNACSEFITVGNKTKIKHIKPTDDVPASMLHTIRLAVDVCTEKNDNVTLDKIEELLKKMPTFSSSRCNKEQLIKIISNLGCHSSNNVF